MIVKKILDYIDQSAGAVKEFIIDNAGESFWKALLEFFRVALIAGVLVLVQGFYQGNFDVKAAIVAAITAFVKAVDKYIHEVGKVEGDASKTLGLVRF